MGWGDGVMGWGWAHVADEDVTLLRLGRGAGRPRRGEEGRDPHALAELEVALHAGIVYF